jgi:hypothetical protein
MANQGSLHVLMGLGWGDRPFNRRPRNNNKMSTILLKNAKIAGEISAKAIAAFTFLGIDVAGKAASFVAPGLNDVIGLCLTSIQQHVDAVTDNDELVQSALQQVKSVNFVVSTIIQYSWFTITIMFHFHFLRHYRWNRSKKNNFFQIVQRLLAWRVRLQHTLRWSRDGLVSHPRKRVLDSHFTK